MIKLEIGGAVQRPIADVFSYVADMSTHPKWDHGCVEAAYTTAGPVRIGAKYRRTDKVFIFRFKGTGEVTEYAPNRKLTFSIDPPMPGKVTLSFDGADGGTRVHGLYEARMQGLSRLFEPLMAPMFRRAARKSMANLKRVLEARA